MEVASSEEDANAPKYVKAKPLLRDHLNVLSEMFNSEEPVLRHVRGSAICEALYIFGDASFLVFVSSWLNEGEISFRFGVWGEEAPDTTSNCRELRNLVETLERNGLDGELRGKKYLFLQITPLQRVLRQKIHPFRHFSLNW